MKKISILVLLLILSITLITSAFGSSHVEYHGNYENQHMNIFGKYISTSWLFTNDRGELSGGSTNEIIFKLQLEKDISYLRKQ